MSKIGKTTELTDEQLDKVSGGQTTWTGGGANVNQNLRSRIQGVNTNINQNTNFFTKLFSIFGANQNSNNNSITNQYSVTNNNSRINNNANFLGINENENQNQNEN